MFLVLTSVAKHECEVTSNTNEAWVERSTSLLYIGLSPWAEGYLVLLCHLHSVSTSYLADFF